MSYRIKSTVLTTPGAPTAARLTRARSAGCGRNMDRRAAGLQPCNPIQWRGCGDMEQAVAAVVEDVTLCYARAGGGRH